MDESLKVTIATLSGFIIAFFADPIKTYFQQRTRKRNIRRALYSEIHFNYDALSSFYYKRMDKEITNRDMYQFVEGIKHIARLEAYQYYITHDMDLFYQFREVATINTLYAELRLLLENAQIRVEKKIPFDRTMEHIQGLLRRYIESIKTGKLDKSLLMEIIGREEINSFMEKEY